MTKGTVRGARLAAVIALCAACAVGVTPAVAAGPAVAVSALFAGPAVGVSGAHGASTPLTSLNWSGYVDLSKTYNAVSASWVEPTVKCTKEDQWAIFWVGFDGWTNSTVEQAGTYGWCYEGTPTYATWWEMYPTTSIVAFASMNPGDRVTASVRYNAGTYTMSVTDHTTTSASFTENQPCGSGLTCSRSSADWIAERPGFSDSGYIPLANFGRWVPTAASATAGATKGTISAFSNGAITMMDSLGNYALASPSALNAKGNSFSDVWKNSY